MDLDTHTLAKTGVVATLNPEGNCIGVRADMDAIPVNGISHACGHDYHMAVVLGSALALKKLGFKKGVKFIFQPAEECVGGALPMINEGVLENPEVRYMVGFHVWPKVKVGTIEVAAGPSMASVDDLHITFIGEGGHAAMPYLCKNPIYPAMDFIGDMTMKSKIENNPLNPHVLTFSSIQCGTAPNIIAEECKVLPLERTFASEDFAYFGEKVPSVHFRLGISDNNMGSHPLHSPEFNASEDAILNGIYIIVNFIMSMEY